MARTEMAAGAHITAAVSGVEIAAVIAAEAMAEAAEMAGAAAEIDK
jgi:hypothetical protein